MAMMRRGALDRYLPTWVLRQAAAESIHGAVTFGRTPPATFFFDDGDVYAAVVGTEPPPADHAVTDADEAEHLAKAVELLVEVQCEVGGDFSVDPLGQHPAIGWWRWDVEALLIASKDASKEVTAASICGNPRIQLREGAPALVTDDADATALAGALVESATTEQVRTALGWKPSRLLAALMKLHREAQLDSAPEPEPMPDDADAPGPRSSTWDPNGDRAIPADEVSSDEDEDDGDAGLAKDEAQTAAEAAEEAAEAEAEAKRKRDLGVGENAPANMALRAWLDTQIPEVILDPLAAPEWWKPEPEPEPEPEPKSRRRILRRPSRPGTRPDEQPST